MESPWIAVSDRLSPGGELVDVWFNVWASPMSFGMADEWCEPRAWRESGKWYHVYQGDKAELNARYISHWKPPGAIDIEGPDAVIWKAVGLASHQ